MASGRASLGDASHRVGLVHRAFSFWRPAPLCRERVQSAWGSHRRRAPDHGVLPALDVVADAPGDGRFEEPLRVTAYAASVLAAGVPTPERGISARAGLS